MQKLKWGVLGCAGFARRRAIPAMLECPSVKLVGIASRTIDKAEAFRAEFGLDRAYGSYLELLSDPEIEAVYVPLPNGLHGEWTIRAAGHGKHVLCEKPFASNAAEAQQVAAAAKQAGVFVAEGFMWRLHSQHLRARRALERGEIGELRLLRASFSFILPRKPNVRLDRKLAGGCVMDVGCYTISAARYYFDSEPSLAWARGRIHTEFGVDMDMAGMLEFSRGRALIDCAFDLPYRTEVEIVGDSGSIVIPKAWLPEPSATLIINGVTEKLGVENQYVSQFERFSACVLSGTPPPYGPEDAVLQMKVVDAVSRSMQSGRPEAI